MTKPATNLHDAEPAAWRGEKRPDLPPRTRFVLDQLAAADGPLNRWRLVDQLAPGAEDDGVLRTYISRLRDFLGDDAIRTARGIGYQLTELGREKYARLCA